MRCVGTLDLTLVFGLCVDLADSIEQCYVELALAGFKLCLFHQAPISEPTQPQVSYLNHFITKEMQLKYYCHLIDTNSDGLCGQRSGGSEPAATRLGLSRPPRHQRQFRCVRAARTGACRAWPGTLQLCTIVLLSKSHNYYTY